MGLGLHFSVGLVFFRYIPSGSFWGAVVCGAIRDPSVRREVTRSVLEGRDCGWRGGGSVCASLAVHIDCVCKAGPLMAVASLPR